MDSGSQPLVSIVTPLYNTERYLRACIESVLTQTYDNWEYLIVNNCSTDRSLEIAQEYAQTDARVRVHNNSEFLSALQNWNHTLGLIAPQSKYCKVIHADDWLFPECLRQMVQVAEANPSVGIVSSYRLDENAVNLDGLPYPSTVVSGREICRLSLLEGEFYVFGSPSSLLIRSDLIREHTPFYNESSFQPDVEACYQILQGADFGFVHQILTFTRRHNESITSFTRRFNTRRIGKLNVLSKFGPAFLSDQEYDRRWKQVTRGYYHFLARSVFELREKEFWNYHRGELVKLGHPLSWTKLAQALFLELLNLRNAFHSLKRGLTKEEEKTEFRWESVLNSAKQ